MCPIVPQDADSHRLGLPNNVVLSMTHDPHFYFDYSYHFAHGKLTAATRLAIIDMILRNYPKVVKDSFNSTNYHIMIHNDTIIVTFNLNLIVEDFFKL